jgi:hypothetical protein
MPRLSFPSLAASLLLSLLLLTACGGGGGNDSLAHIEGSSATITKPMLDHWMRVTVASDFRSVIGTKAPIGLASEPANYGECAEAAKKVSKRSFTGKLRLSDAEISRKCHQLHQVVLEQALGFLISSQWEALLAKEQHVSVSDAELHREFLRYRKEAYKTEAKYQTYLAEHRLVLSDVLYQLRRSVYVTRILPKFKAKVNAAGGGLKTYAKLAFERHDRLVAKTTCKAGYVMEDCKGYRAPAKPLPAPNLILEGIVQGARLVGSELTTS